jgi:ceramide glucosyltransferase
LKTFLLLCSLILCSSLGEILCAKGMQQIGDVSFRPRALLGAFWRMLRNQYLFFGIVFMAASFFSFISLLSYADLSFVVPLTAVGYITNTLGARFFLHERISRERWLGTLLVAFGVFLISLSGTLEAMLRANWENWMDWLYSAFAPVWVESPVGFWLLFGLRVVLFGLVLAAIVYSGFALLGALAWFVDRRKQRALGFDFTPPTTILKPVRGADDEAYENFASFCRQHYPEYQIVFGVREETDPAVAVIRRLMADFPALDIELVISPDEIGHNAKVSNLQNIFAKAKHGTLLIVDSDIRVGSDYLRRVVAPMQRDRVGMVTCLYRGVKARSFAALLENIGISASFAPEVCSARLLQGIAFAFGSTIVLRRDLLERIGGFPAIADYLADDYLLGQAAAKAGYEVVLSDCIVNHIAGGVSFDGMLNHQLRWAQAKRLSRPWGYRGLILTYGTATSLLALIAWGFSSFAWVLFAAAMLARFLQVFVVGVFGLKDKALARYCWLVPVRDLITFGVWVASFFNDEIEWQGDTFKILPCGKLVPVSKTR